MQFIPFFKKCPETADKETRMTMLMDEQLYGIPAGQYAYIENYCNDPECDCRKVMINVFRIDDKNSKIIATIGFGWGNIQHYTKWLNGDVKLAKEMKELSIEQGAPQSQYSEACLELVKNNCLNDKKFIERLKRHYSLFKKSIKNNQSIKTDKIGRNKPCPCGSDKKYKKCCLDKNQDKSPQIDENMPLSVMTRGNSSINSNFKIR